MSTLEQAALDSIVFQVDKLNSQLGMLCKTLVTQGDVSYVQAASIVYLHVQIVIPAKEGTCGPGEEKPKLAGTSVVHTYTISSPSIVWGHSLCTICDPISWQGCFSLG